MNVNEKDRNMLMKKYEKERNNKEKKDIMILK